MKKQNEFVIPFKGLDIGSHFYSFKIDSAFFEGFDYFETETGTVNVDLELLKESTLFDFHFKLDGIVNLVCDRCLGKFDKHIKGNFRMIVKFGETFSEESEEVIILPVSESSIDISQYIFEYINLLLPIKRVHENENDCDPVMIQKLQNHKKQENDPRWDALKKMNLK